MHTHTCTHTHTHTHSRTWRLLSLLAETDVTQGLAAAMCNALGVTEEELDVRGCLARAGAPLPLAVGAGVAEWRAAGGDLVARLLGAAAAPVKGSPRFQMEDDGEGAMLWCVYRRLGEGAEGQGEGEGDLLQVVVANDAFGRAFTVGCGGGTGAEGWTAASSTTASSGGSDSQAGIGPTYGATIQHGMLYLPLLLLALVRHEDRDGVCRLLLEAMLTDGQAPTPPGPSRRTELAKCFTAQGDVNLYVIHRRALTLPPNQPQPYPPPQPDDLRASVALLRFEVAPASR